MAYQALYRRLRPQRFEDVVGQEHIIRTLQNQIENNRINHAYLFCGTRGTGKTTTAKIFARAINKMVLANGIAYTFITVKDMEECNATSKNLDAVVGYLLNTEGAKVAIFASERDCGITKLSFRSKELNVNEIAQLYGGHILAAGASVNGNIVDVLKNAVNETEKRLMENE